MRISVPGLLDDSGVTLLGRVFGVYALLAVANVGSWLWAISAFHDYPVLLGTAALAYGLGLRHAFDADHIAAIDNVTRKLMQQGRRPVAVGLFFSLGHSTIVGCLSIAVALAETKLQGQFSALRNVGEVIGSLVSALFLFGIAIANGFILVTIYRTFRNVKNGGACIEEDLDLVATGFGFLARVFHFFFQAIRSSWQMYPLGLLFGLGFDTATEVGVLGIAATQSAQGLSIWSILVFPALFTAGMTLIDTTDNVLMLEVYRWAFIKPIRKLYYNLTITFASAVLAATIGFLETLNLVGDQLGLSAEGGFWGAIGLVNDNFDIAGGLIVALFLATWILSYIVYRAKRYHEIEASL